MWNFQLQKHTMTSCLWKHACVDSSHSLEYICTCYILSNSTQTPHRPHTLKIQTHSANPSPLHNSPTISVIASTTFLPLLITSRTQSNTSASSTPALVEILTVGEFKSSSIASCHRASVQSVLWRSVIVRAGRRLECEEISWRREVRR